MNRLAHTSAAILLGAALLTGCGGGDDAAEKESASPTPSPSATPTEAATPTVPADTDFGSPARGRTVTGKGYTYRMPKGWKETKPRTGDRAIDTVSQEPSADDGFRDNLTVGLQKAPAGSTLDELEASVAEQLAGSVPNVEVRPRVVIEGVEALHYGGDATVGTVKYHLEEFVTVDENGAITVISFSFSPELGATSRKKLTDSVLASWTWTA